MTRFKCWGLCKSVPHRLHANLIITHHPQSPGTEALSPERPALPRSPLYIQRSLRGQCLATPSIKSCRGLWRGCPPTQAKFMAPFLPWMCQLHGKVWRPLRRPAQGTPIPASISLSLSLPGGPGLPRELGAAHHCPGARGRLHLLPEAAAAPDDRAQRQGGGQWVQQQ